MKSKKFNIPVICIGNLSTGGTGKTPHVEYIIKLLQSKKGVAVLSRGYGRDTSGFLEVTLNSAASDVGDEPLQIKQKFNNANIFVCENRCSGIKKILGQNKETQVVILDDAFQHRKVAAGLNILLTPLQSLYTDDLLLPVGNLRESPAGAKRAQLIIVTKCPPDLLLTKKNEVEKKLAIQPNQHLLFSSLEYSSLQSISGSGSIPIEELKTKSILLLTGIASTQVLINFLQTHSHSVDHLKFSDHHSYCTDDLMQLKRKFDIIASPNKIIITTEKDSVKLKNKNIFSQIKDLPVFFLPVKVKFENNDALKFKSIIEDYVGKN